MANIQEMAHAAIAAVHRRGRLPILAGGTGQYVSAVIEGWGIPRVPPQPRLRAALERLGEGELNRWLQALDPAAAAKIHPHNLRRVIRALEVTLAAGRPISELQRRRPPAYDLLIIGLDAGRDTLYERIDRRVDEMLAQGLLEEVGAARRRLWLAPAGVSALGYRQLGLFARRLSLEEAVERIKYETHRFVRQQYTWFRRDDPRIHWFDIGEAGYEERAAALVAAWLGAGPGDG